MFYYLRSSNQKKLLERYEANIEYWKNIDDENQRQQYKNLPHWFTYIVKWFLHGVNGPFGTVSKLSDGYVQAFYHNNMELTKVAKKTSLKYVGHDEDVFCFKQNDNVNCGICCLLFMIDFVSTQVECSWEVKNKVLSNVPNLSTIGTTFFWMLGLKI